MSENQFQPYEPPAPPAVPAPPPVPMTAAATAVQPYRPTNGVAIAGMIIGIGCLIFFWCGVFELIGIVVAIVLSSVGISAANKGAPNKGMAIAGLVCSLVGVVLYLIAGLSTLGVGFFL